MRPIHFFKIVPNCLAQFPAELWLLILHWIVLMDLPSKKSHINYFTLMKHKTMKENVGIIVFQTVLSQKSKSLLASIFKFHTWEWNQPIYFLRKKYHLLSAFSYLKEYSNQLSPKLFFSWNVHFLATALQAKTTSSNSNFIAFQFLITFQFMEIKTPSQVHWNCA